MTAKKFSNALGGIGEGYIDEAVKYTAKKKSSAWLKWACVAACLLLFVAGGLLGNIFHSPDDPGHGILSYFVITAQAANGESTNLNVTDSCINWNKPNYSLFGHDTPLFRFDVTPSDLQSNEAIYQRFDISVSYNGTTVTDKDEHISVAYIHSAPSSQTYGYSVFGWFAEPTDVIITVTDKESKEVVEEMTVNVKYDANRQEYALTITKLDTTKESKPAEPSTNQ